MESGEDLPTVDPIGWRDSYTLSQSHALYGYRSSDRIARLGAALFFLVLGCGGLLVSVFGLDSIRGRLGVVGLSVFAFGLASVAIHGARARIARLSVADDRLLVIKKGVVIRAIPWRDIQSFRHAPWILDPHAVLRIRSTNETLRVYYGIEPEGELIGLIAARVTSIGSTDLGEGRGWHLSWSRVIPQALLWAAPFVAFAILPLRSGAYGAVMFLGAIGVGGSALWILANAFGPRKISLTRQSLSVTAGGNKTREIQLRDISGLRICFLTRGRQHPSLLIDVRDGPPILVGLPVVDPIQMLTRIIMYQPGLQGSFR